MDKAKMPDISLESQIKISHASYAGVPLQKIADHLGLTLRQVEAVVAIDQGFRKEQADFSAWVEANKEASDDGA
jgi:hypothetical protein